MIHLAIADTANDQNGNEVWLAQATLAKKARVGIRSVREAMNTLVQAGYLAELSGVSIATGGRDVRRFLFLFPDVPVIYETRSNRQPLPVAKRSDAIDQPAVAAGSKDRAIGKREQSNRQPLPINPKKQPKGFKPSVANATEGSGTGSPDTALFAPVPPLPDPVEAALKRATRSLAVLAFEQPVKPVINISRDGQAFPAVAALIERQLRAGRPAADIEAAIRAGVDAWTTGGLGVAIGRVRGRADTRSLQAQPNRLSESERAAREARIKARERALRKAEADPSLLAYVPDLDPADL